MAEIRLAQPSDSQWHWEHLNRIHQESGRDGDFIFNPQEDWGVPLDNFMKSYEAKLSKSFPEIGWARTWVLADADGIYGDLQLMHRPPLKNALHRALLMMGIQRSHRNQGLGSKMMTEALTWAKAQPGLDWIELHVFENNLPAKKLYTRFGFREIGTTPDMFRVHGAQIANTSMVLKLR